MSATEADIPVETLILHVTLQKNQLNLMGLVHAMRSNGPLPQVAQMDIVDTECLQTKSKL